MISTFCSAERPPAGATRTLSAAGAAAAGAMGSAGHRTRNRSQLHFKGGRALRIEGLILLFNGKVWPSDAGAAAADGACFLHVLLH